MPSPDEIIAAAKSKGITLRPATALDGPAILNVAKSAFPKGNWWTNPSDCQKYSTVATGANSRTCVVAEVGGAVVGYIFYKMRSKDVYISDTGVDAANQGGGIGALLLAYVLAVGYEIKQRYVTLYTANDADGADMRKRYKKLGFKDNDFGYTTDDDNSDTGSCPMKASLSVALSSIEGKL